jgi:hypothetical protein
MMKVEERIIGFRASSAEEAYAISAKKGREGRYKFKNDDGVTVHFEFVGVLDLMHLGVEADEDEVWYEFRRMKCPMSRKGSIVPSRFDLPAFKYERALLHRKSPGAKPKR